MPEKVLATTLTGRDLLSPVLAKAAANADRFERDMEGVGGSVETSTRRAADAAQRELGRMGGVFQRSGEDAGGRLAQGISSGVRGRTALIAAGVGAALAAGAPAVTAAAAGLFAGIGVVAAAQSVQVQRAWAGTWQTIRDGTIAAAGPIEDALQGLAGTVGDAFERMRPLLERAFAAAAPLVGQFGESLLQVAENALPGLVRAVESAGPVFDGLGSLLADVGSGLGDMFDILAGQAPAAGQAFAGIGDVLRQLLPILGQLLGTGAQVASTVLPAVASALGVVAGALDAIAPVLPVVVTGLIAMKAAGVATAALGGLSGGLTRVSQNLAFASYSGGVFAGAAGTMSTAVSGATRAVAAIGTALPVIGVVGAVAATRLADIDQTAREMADGLRRGGQAAADAQTQLQGLADSWGGASGALASSQLPDWMLKAGSIFGGVSSSMYEAAAATRETTDALQAQWRAMSPLEQAQSKVAEWTQTLAYRMDTLGASAGDTQVAQQRLAYWQKQAADAARDEAEATQGTAIAMQDAKTAADNLKASLEAMNQPVLSLRDAQRQYQQALDDARKALEENGRTLDITTEKGRANAGALDKIAASAQETAKWVYETTGSYDQFRTNLEGARQQLYDQAVAFGYSKEQASAYVDEVLGIPSQWRTVAEFDTTTAMGEVRGILSWLKTQEPNATINIGVISEQAYNQLADLGLKLQALPDGTVNVTLGSDPSGDIQRVQTLLDGVDGRTVTAVGKWQSEIADGVSADLQLLSNLGLIAPEVVARYQSDIPTKTDADLSELLRLDAFDPLVSPGYSSDVPAGTQGDILKLLGLDGFLATPQARLGDTVPGQVAVDLSRLAGLDGVVATPTADLNNAPFVARYASSTALARQLDSQRPTPVANLNSGPFTGIYGRVMSNIGALAGQRPTPTASMIDRASGTAAGIIGLIGRIVSKTVTITTVQRTIYEAGPRPLAYGGAIRASAREPIYAAAGRRVTGPGGPTDDLVYAVGPGGAGYRLSDGEWIVNAAVSRAQGDARMALLNAGLADIVPAAMPGYGTGYSPSSSVTNDNRRDYGGIHVTRGEDRDLPRRIVAALREDEFLTSSSY